MSEKTKMTQEEKDLMENLMSLYNKLERGQKTRYIIYASDDMDLSPFTLRNNYFGGFGIVRKPRILRMITLIQNFTFNENLKKSI